MRNVVFIYFLFLGFTGSAQRDASQLKTIHIYVALCDNENQGIVPVSEALGNGQNPASNLYWGAFYGVKTYFKRSSDWTLIKKLESPNATILERVLFKHRTSETYLLADAYDGMFIQQTTSDFLKAASGDLQEVVGYNDISLGFGGRSNLIGYIGHDGLMEFNLDLELSPCNTDKRDTIILACISKDYFKEYLVKTNANPLFGQQA